MKKQKVPLFLKVIEKMFNIFLFYNKYYHCLFCMPCLVPRLNWSVQFSPPIGALISIINSCTLAFVFSYKQNTNIFVILNNMLGTCFRNTKMHECFYFEKSMLESIWSSHKCLTVLFIILWSHKRILRSSND